MKCGIPKYNKLPARVGWIDVDYLRFRLQKNLEEYTEIKKRLDKAVKEVGK